VWLIAADQVHAIAEYEHVADPLALWAPIVALTLTVNPITAAIFGALLLGEPIRLPLVVGLLGVATGIWVAAGLRVPARGRSGE